MANNQYVNKVKYGNNTLIDLTGDTVTASSLLSGHTAHDASGAPVMGNVVVVTYYVSSSSPTSSQGNNGDIWLKTVS